MSKTILIFSNVTAGLLRFRRELLELLVQSYRVVVLSSDNGGKDEIQRIGCAFIDVDIERHGKNPLKEIVLISEIAKNIKQFKPFVVLTYTIKPNIYGGIACSFLHVPYIVNITGLGDAIENSGLIATIAKILYKTGIKKAQKVFFQNQSNADFFISKKLYSGPYDVLPGSGVNLLKHRFEPYPSEEKDVPYIFCVIGRMTKDKGIHEIIEASYNFSPEELRIQLIGACEDDCLDLIHRAEKHGVIHYYGRQEDVHEWLKHAHAILHASYHEGMSNVLLEAAACGRPILATAIPGCKETFDEGISGIGFLPRSSEAIITVINRFIELPYAKKVEMGLRGREKMESEFNRDIVVDKYIKEIETIEEFIK